MTKSTITREQLLEIIETDHVQCGEASYLARMALAAMDSEPVAYISKSDFDAGYPHILARRDFNKACTMPVYAAQPAPVVPVVPDEIKHRIGGLDWGWEGEFNRGWNACRAAMLQELKKSAGTEAICRSDENVQVLHTKSPAQSDCCPAQNHVSPEQNVVAPAQIPIDHGYLPECECSGCKATARISTEMAVNSLVIPNEMTSEQAYEIGYYYGDPVDVFARGANWMRQHIIDSTLAAAPQLPGSEPATVPGKWIPVSERMPDDDDFVYIWPRPDFGVELHVGQYCECSPKGDGWYAQVYEQNYGIEWHPITVTHWMPLPAAPQEVNHG